MINLFKYAIQEKVTMIHLSELLNTIYANTTR